MGVRLANYLFFRTGCREALRFYEACGLGKVVQLWEYGMDGRPLPDDSLRGKVMHSWFEGPGVSFYASDNIDAEPMRGSAHLLMVNDEQAARSLFHRLSAGGAVTTPLAIQSWGGLFGKFTDRFGVQWMINCEAAPRADQNHLAGAFERARIQYTMLRVRDLDRAVAFYTGPLGMTEWRREDYPGGKFTLSFVGYGEEAHNAVIELTHNWGDHTYERGTAYGHIALGVPDIRAAVESLREQGVRIVREPGPMAHGTDVIAFIEDPDGYRIELIEEPR